MAITVCCNVIDLLINHSSNKVARSYGALIHPSSDLWSATELVEHVFHYNKAVLSFHFQLTTEDLTSLFERQHSTHSTQSKVADRSDELQGRTVDTVTESGEDGTDGCLLA